MASPNELLRYLLVRSCFCTLTKTLFVHAFLSLFQMWKRRPLFHASGLSEPRRPRVPPVSFRTQSKMCSVVRKYLLKKTSPCGWWFFGLTGCEETRRTFLRVCCSACKLNRLPRIFFMQNQDGRCELTRHVVWVKSDVLHWSPRKSPVDQ